MQVLKTYNGFLKIRCDTTADHLAWTSSIRTANTTMISTMEGQQLDISAYTYPASLASFSSNTN